MRTLVPAQFLRVADKFFGRFVLADEDLKQGPTLLYLVLFFMSHQKDCAWPSQAFLARACKCTERSIQTYTQTLVDFGYVRMERNAGRLVYRLLYSDRVCALLFKSGIESLPELPDTKNFPVTAENRGEKFSHNKRNLNTRRNSPLSPLTEPPAPLASSTQTSSPCQGGCVCSPEPVSGDSPLNAATHSTHPALPPSTPNSAPRGTHCADGASFAAPNGEGGEAAFERLFSAWPLKKDKLHAEQVFRRLTHSRVLPPLQELLNVVERFKAEDRSWRNGCVPNLAFWLKGHRWLDEVQPPVCATTAAPVHSGSVKSTPTDASLRKHIRAAHEQFLPQPEQPPTVPPEVIDTVEALKNLWPDAPRVQIMCALFLARQRGAQCREIVNRAREYRLSVDHPIPVADWLKAVA